MIAIVHSIYSQSVHALVLNAGLMDNDTERYCSLVIIVFTDNYYFSTCGQETAQSYPQEIRFLYTMIMLVNLL